MTRNMATGRTAARTGTRSRASLLGLSLAGALLAASAIGLGGCGNDPVTRGVSGGLIGAGAGAGIAAVTGGKPATGALIGGGVGAAGGVLTTP